MISIFGASLARRVIAPVLGGIVFMGSALAADAGQAYYILDARTGKTLASDHADTLNHPASLTKMMTLYITFEALHSGRLGWNSKITMTRNAARKPPTKLGVAAGKTITVREAVSGMIVKSANDAAAAVADELGGSEVEFGRMMTKRARRLGMSRTTFYNASGLPHARQFTTARDMSTLGIALQRDFPNEYKLFSMKSFSFRGRVIRGHNNLMYRFEGMDGIKTGYTNASGFNLVSSVRQGNRRLVGVVLGGTTARSRDARMAGLLEKYMPDGENDRSGTLVASRGQSRRIAASQMADIPVPRLASRKLAEIEIASADDAISQVIAAAPTTRSITVPVSGDWVVQIAATDSKASAMDLLSEAQRKTGQSFSPYTEAVGQGGTTLYRARFVNFASRQDAKDACVVLKKSAYSCLVLSTR